MNKWVQTAINSDRLLIRKIIIDIILLFSIWSYLALVLLPAFFFVKPSPYAFRRAATYWLPSSPSIQFAGMSSRSHSSNWAQQTTIGAESQKFDSRPHLISRLDCIRVLPQWHRHYPHGHGGPTLERRHLRIYPTGCIWPRRPCSIRFLFMNSSNDSSNNMHIHMGHQPAKKYSVTHLPFNAAGRRSRDMTVPSGIGSIQGG